jgi:hypothetical protein
MDALAAVFGERMIWIVACRHVRFKSVSLSFMGPLEVNSHSLPELKENIP